MTAAGPWLRRLTPTHDGAEITLVCCPHAGGWPSFLHPWSRHVGPRVDLWVAHYPGRETRLAEEPLESLPPIADRVAEAVRDVPPRQLYLFGHSFGAAVAYEVARRLTHGGVAVQRLIVSGRPAPVTSVDPPMHTLSDADLVKRVQGFGLLEVETVSHAELLELVLRPLRSDLRASETYRLTSREPLDVELVVLVGAEDPVADAMADSQGVSWDALTSGRVSHETLPGGHFYTAPNLIDAIEPSLS